MQVKEAKAEKHKGMGGKFSVDGEGRDSLSESV